MKFTKNKLEDSDVKYTLIRTKLVRFWYVCVFAEFLISILTCFVVGNFAPATVGISNSYC